MTDNKKQKTFHCSYCNQVRDWGIHNKKATSGNGKGEHFIPSSCGSPIKSKEICDECNTNAADLVDDAFINSDIIRFLIVYFGVKPDRGKPKNKEVYQVEVAGHKANLVVTRGNVERKLVIAPIINNNLISITVNKEEEEKAKRIIKDIINKKMDRGTLNSNNFILKQTEDKIPPDQFLPLSVDSNVIGRAHAKMMLGLTGYYYPEFKSSPYAEQLRKYYKKELNQCLSFHGGWDIQERTFAKLQDKQKKGICLHLFRLYSNKGKLEIHLGTFGSIAYTYGTDINFSKQQEKEIVIDPRKCSFKEIK
ncbi:hypothetical protein [Sutcliffiella horikoshii]|uniref:HNH endonuclease 5 domain-containing protein n=1 Tax=Sutcliffiella horikoshii TaxID=79883 RepID=A0A5D4T2Q8_9BACI|nr:hypothetical protein [Sutcliffiella horikoshii]TYS69990.1 hypothetical protein FZC75_15220 [Sutcliffiella horikoshii]